MTYLPDLWPLRRLAIELGRKPASLVAASQRGQFPPLVRIGRDWFVRADAMRAWMQRDHVHDAASRVQTAVEVADAAAGCQGRRGRRRAARGSSERFGRG